MGLMENQMRYFFGFPDNAIRDREQNQVGLNHRKSGITEIKTWLFSWKLARWFEAQAEDGQLQPTVLCYSTNEGF